MYEEYKKRRKVIELKKEKLTLEGEDADVDTALPSGKELGPLISSPLTAHLISLTAKKSQCVLRVREWLRGCTCVCMCAHVYLCL